MARNPSSRSSSRASRSASAGRVLARARTAELAGDLAQATALFAEAGRLDEAARVMVLRGDAEADPGARLRHYVQAAATAPDGSAASRVARRKRALLVVATARDGAVTATVRLDLAEAARDLEAIGEASEAAAAYALSGDVEGQARALSRAGEVEKLDALLVEQQRRDHEALASREAQDEMAMLVASGRRREAAAVARASTDEALRDRGRALEARRVSGRGARLTVRGQQMMLVMGDEVVIGRVREAATIPVASPAVSRRHLSISRRGPDVVVRDLGSRNGTTLRGLLLSGELCVGERLELRLGREVPLVVEPSTEMAGATAIEIGGVRYVAPLAPARLGIGRWRLEQGENDWLELVTEDDPPAFAGGLRLAQRVTLIAGDAIGCEREAAPVIVMER